jgi:hypothetical protein
MVKALITCFLSRHGCPQSISKNPSKNKSHIFSYKVHPKHKFILDYFSLQQFH